MISWQRRLLAYARPHAAGLAASLALTLIIIGLEALRPWPMKIIVDHVLPRQPLPAALAWLGEDGPAILVGAALTTVFLFLAAQGLRLLQAQLNARVGSRMVYTLGADLFHRLQSLSLRFHGRMAAGDLVRRVMTDSGCVREYVVSGLLPVITASVNLLVMLAIMGRLNWQLALVAAVAAGPLGWLIRVCAGPMRDRSYEQQQAQGAVMTTGERALSALPVVQAFQQEEREVAGFRARGAAAVTAAVRTVDAQLRFRIGTGAFTALGAAVVMAWGGWHVLDGQLTLGGLLVIMAYVAALYAPLQTLAYVTIGFADAAAGAQRVFELMDRQEAVQDRPHARAVPAAGGGARGRVEFEGVTFGYEAGRPVLREIALTAEPGEVIALVGPTGAGKSTLASLVPRFFDPGEGVVRFAGVDLRELRLAELRAQVSLVLQEPFLLPVSIAENIAYGRPGATDAAIRRAAQAAQAEEFIERLPNGYETVIGERGATLSGGQKQRLAIARALLRDAAVMIFDEPTSALDTATEAEILAALQVALKGRTAFLIAHRLSTVRLADRIVVLEQGRIVEAGSPAELLAANGAYRRLHDLQARGAASRPETDVG